MIRKNLTTTTAPRFRPDQLATPQRRHSRPVVVALDGGFIAERAIPFAQALAERWRAPLRLVHVRNPVDESYGRDLSMVDDGKTLTVHTRPGAYLAGLAESLRAATNLRVGTRTVSGVSIADTLRSVCRDDARALVMVRTQRSALSRFFSGSVADNLIGHSPVPLLVVPASPEGGPAPSDAQKPLFTRLLTYFDGSEVFTDLLKQTVAIAPEEAVCQLLRVLPLASLFGTGRGGFLPTADPRNDAWIELFKARDVLEQQGILCKPRLVFDGQSAPSAIVDRAQASRSELIVMAAHPHLLPWWLRDGVVESVIRRVSIPVLVVPGGKTADSLLPPGHVDIESN